MWQRAVSPERWRMLLSVWPLLPSLTTPNYGWRQSRAHGRRALIIARAAVTPTGQFLFYPSHWNAADLSCALVQTPMIGGEISSEARMEQYSFTSSHRDRSRGKFTTTCALST